MAAKSKTKAQLMAELESLHQRNMQLERRLYELEKKDAPAKVLPETYALETGFRTLIENFPNGAVALIDRNFRYILAGGEGFEKIGKFPSDLVGKRLQDVWPKDLYEMIKPIYEDAFYGKTQVVELHLSGFDWLFHIVPNIKATEHGPETIIVVAIDITAFKRLERENRLVRERLEFLLAQNPAIIYGADPSCDFETTFVSKNLERIHGHLPEKYYRYPHFWISTANPGDIDEAVKWVEGIDEATKQIKDSLLKSGAFNVEYRLQNQDGSFSWIQDRGRLIYDEAGNPLEVVGCMIDITEQKQNQEELGKYRRRLENLVKERTAALEKEIEERKWADEAYRNLVEHSIQGLHIIQDSRIIFVNPMLSKITGYSAEELLSMGLEELLAVIHPEDVQSARAQWQHHKNAPRNTKYRIIRKDGQIRWTEFFTTVVSYHGKPSFQITSMDITERIEARKALQESEERMRLAVQNVPVMLSAVDQNNNLIVWNKECEQVTGYSDEEVIGNPDIWEKLYPDKVLRETVFNSWADHMGDSRNRELELTCKDGTKKMISWSGNAGRYPIPGWRSWGIGVDVTKQKQAMDALRESEAHYRFLAEIVAEGIGIIREEKFIFVNSALSSLLGYTKSELLEIHPFSLIHEDHKKYFYKIFDPSGTDSGGEKDHRRCFWGQVIGGGGRKIWTEWHRDAVKWEGEPSILVTVRDITETKRREIALKEEKENIYREYIELKESSIKNQYKFGYLVGKSRPMQDIYSLILKASECNENVIIYGESGTGKELVARSIHDRNDRRSKPFVPVNCGAIPETLFESEFFGYRKGAFTGAVMNKHGFFCLANQGTLFLDEVGELSLNMQVKFLRAIEGGTYTPLGSEEPRNSDVRIIAATNKNLAEMVKKKLFREDLFYRLHVIPITVPPLRERKEDIPLLAEHFLSLHGNPNDPRRISGQIYESLFKHDWPGNVRELENMLKRYLATNQIDFIHMGGSRKTEDEYPEETGLRELLQGFEEKIIIQTLERNRWHKGKTARMLGIPERTLYRKLKQFHSKTS
jgi:PAS domain S-box-containing protein